MLNFQPNSPISSEQERDFYGSPIPPNSLTPYPYSRQQLSSPQAGLAPLAPYAPRGNAPRSNPGQIIPYFDPPPHEHSSSQGSGSRHHHHHRRRSKSHSQDSRPPAVTGQKSGLSVQKLGAELVGVAGGSYLGHKLAGGGLGTVLGALAGGYAAHKASEKREGNREKKGRKSRGEDVTVESFDSNQRRSRRGSAPPPLSGQLYPPDAGRSRRHSRSGRSRSRRRNDSTSSDNSSEDDYRRRRRH